MKSFDAFARPVQEFQVKTAIGGYISIGSICLVAVLFFSELSYFLTLDTKDEMLIDQSQERKYLNASLDISFSALPCSVLSVNLMDPKQNNVMHVAHEIYKTRLSSTGEVIGKPIRIGLENVAMTPADLATVFRDIPTRANHSSAISRCPSCFQSLFDEDSCCNSCKEVREAFLNRGWDDRPDDYVFVQCIEEAYQRTAAEANEGCRLKARLHVRKVPATLHIGVSQRIRRDLVRASSLADVTVSADFSHHIHNLSFGPDFPGLVRVLDGRQKSSHQKPTSEHYQYDVHVIPTRYQEDGSDEIAGHQYSVTEYVKAVDARDPGHKVGATGVWMSCDFTPFEVRVTRSRKSMFHFFTECCAILGGIFAFSGMLDGFAHQIHKSLENGSRRSVLE
ncbi:ergic3 [Symbiodinium pilosum]|uniref:Ergic3 protein n=1 Tax=Symbiodinium pilosum TaxID=2952 RepID=A0A812W0J4_SYMPI|nr:ergic3 [Symbiodinium pilosum]